MNKRRVAGLSLSLCLVLFLNLFLWQEDVTAKPRPITNVKLTLENQPEIGGTAIFRLIMFAPKNLNLEKARLTCFLPEGLELINDKNYEIIPTQTLANRESGYEVVFYSGPMMKGEKKEITFKVSIPDGKKYSIHPIGGGEGVELDLGDPEPPEWSPQNKDFVSIKEGVPQIKSGIKRLADRSLTDLSIPQDSLPPLRTELLVRTKDRPYYDYYDELVAQRKAGLIPVRYLVYTEKETPNLKVTLTLPKNLGFVKIKEDKEDYPVSTLEDGRKQVLLYSGSMRLKQTKAFYFKLGALSREEELPLLATVESTTLEGEKLLKEDKLLIDLRPGLVY